MISFMYRYHCSKCKKPISDKAHEYCKAKNMPDSCFEHQVDFIDKTMKKFDKKVN